MCLRVPVRMPRRSSLKYSRGTRSHLVDRNANNVVSRHYLLPRPPPILT